MTKMTTMHAADHHTAKHNGTWRYRGAGRTGQPGHAAGASPARAKTASPPGAGIRPDGEETEQPGTAGQPRDATAAARTRR